MSGYTIVVAYTKKGRVIGRSGGIPWRIKEDLANFKRLTEGHIVVMGRKTYESLPDRVRPLPNRINVVLSSTEGSKQGSYMIGAIEEIPPLSMIFPAKSVFIIGGQQVYEKFLASNMVHRVIASEINSEYEGDRFFPALEGVWYKQILKLYPEFDLVQYTKG